MEEHRQTILSVLEKVTGSPDITDLTGRFRQTRMTLQTWRDTMASTNELIKHGIEGKRKVDAKQWTSAFNNIYANINASSQESTRDTLLYIKGAIDSMQSSDSDGDDIIDGDNNDSTDDEGNGDGNNDNDDGKNEERGGQEMN
ncbi:hypothetical protein BJ875DRAFT_539302 [Amylocarpus encephaloides]|uniref:Uncharacterized protein n=1 Tax=Amylocarpus encephaloides TaxID=45428 RepID=A0A9P7YS80_9HELO|nr:hypothetical protein BJ875DRAFT_539302 [Amylocarpus encephaloides]